jgi:zinc/manganese transport system permease protein
VGVLLIFALIVAPPAIAERLTTRPNRGIMLSAVLALAFTWSGLAVAYYVPYPVGFFITTIAFASYLVARSWSYFAARRAARTRGWRDEQARHSP